MHGNAFVMGLHDTFRECPALGSGHQSGCQAPTSSTARPRSVPAACASSASRAGRANAALLGRQPALPAIVDYALQFTYSSLSAKPHLQFHLLTASPAVMIGCDCQEV